MFKMDNYKPKNENKYVVLVRTDKGELREYNSDEKLIKDKSKPLGRSCVFPDIESARWFMVMEYREKFFWGELVAYSCRCEDFDVATRIPATDEYQVLHSYYSSAYLINEIWKKVYILDEVDVHMPKFALLLSANIPRGTYMQNYNAYKKHPKEAKKYEKFLYDARVRPMCLVKPFLPAKVPSRDTMIKVIKKALEKIGADTSISISSVNVLKEKDLVSFKFEISEYAGKGVMRFEKNGWKDHIHETDEPVITLKTSTAMFDNGDGINNHISVNKQDLLFRVYSALYNDFMGYVTEI